ncbi:MAG: deoxyribonuclease IV [Sphaerochaetaceae bacterium]
MHIGCHLSNSKGFLAMGRTAASIEADTFQFFTRNPRGSKAKPIDPADADSMMKFIAERGFGPVIAHAPYTLNPCSKDAMTREFARMTMKDDLMRMEYTPGMLYNFHPGSHTGQGLQVAIAQIAETLNALLRPEQTTTVLLETMAGKGSEVGASFQELRLILDCIDLQDKVGICLDTCHVHDAGYDIKNNLDGVLEEFDSILVLGRLKAIHINDSMNPIGSHKDRHARIGEGFIGLEALHRITHHPALSHLPFCLETPNDLDGYKREIALLRKQNTNPCGKSLKIPDKSLINP